MKTINNTSCFSLATFYWALDINFREIRVNTGTASIAADEFSVPLKVVLYSGVFEFAHCLGVSFTNFHKYTDIDKVAPRDALKEGANSVRTYDVWT